MDPEDSAPPHPNEFIEPASKGAVLMNEACAPAGQGKKNPILHERNVSK